MSDAPTWDDPDFYGHLLHSQRVGDHLRTTPLTEIHPRRLLLQKLHSYTIAASHGVRVPTILGCWPTSQAVAWGRLPETFVLKTNAGHSGNSVWPLKRTGSGYQTVDGRKTFTQEELEETVTASATGRKLPIFAEELLTPNNMNCSLPDDIKVYAAYGTILQIMLRRMPIHADTSAAQYRYISREGEDLGRITPSRRVAADIPLPTHLEEVRKAAERLSRAVPLPFVRVDLYDLQDGIVFGELTATPGGMQRFTPEHSKWMAQEWERAEARLQADLANGRPYRTLLGPHPTTHVPSVTRRTSSVARGMGPDRLRQGSGNSVTPDDHRGNNTNVQQSTAPTTKERNP